MDSLNRNIKPLCRNIAELFQALPAEFAQHKKALRQIKGSLNRVIEQSPNSKRVKDLLLIYQYALITEEGAGRNDIHFTRLHEYTAASIDARSVIGWWFKDTCTKHNLFGFEFQDKEEEENFNLEFSAIKIRHRKECQALGVHLDDHFSIHEAAMFCAYRLREATSPTKEVL